MTKAVILAGGMGTRIAEESSVRPKPMVEIGGKPILWHILKLYTAHGITDFVICLGYKGYLIKEWFANYVLHTSDVTIEMATGAITVHERYAEPWRVTLVDTGEQTLTGGRIRRIRRYVQDDELFLLTYGDGVGDVDIRASIEFHKRQKTLCTLTAAQPPGRFGALNLVGDKVATFAEKPQGEGGFINAGFFVCSPKVCDYVAGDAIMWEREPLERLSQEGQLSAFLHHGFWQPMDTLRDKQHLEQLWQSGRAPWKQW